MALLYINLIIAFIWMALSSTPHPESLAIGYVVGFLILAIFDQLYKEDAYVRRTLGFLKFILFLFGLRIFLSFLFVILRIIIKALI